MALSARMPPLREWQLVALERWSEHGRGVASVVTGGGKTTFAISCVAQQLSLDARLRVLVVVPTRALQDQWTVELARAFGLAHGDIGTSGSAVLSSDEQVVVLVANTARKVVPAMVSKDRWMVVADECHRYGSPLNRLAVRGEWRSTLGLSATPTREYDNWFEEFVASELGPVIFEYDHADALADGVLTPFAVVNYKVPLTESEGAEVARLTRRIAALMSGASAETDGSLERVLQARARVVQRARARLPAAVKIMEYHRGEKAIVFHESIDAADSLASLLRDAGHRVGTYHSRMDSAARLRDLFLYRNGQSDVLVTCRALDEGFDVPDATFGLICASTASTRQRIQRMGRVLRSATGKSAAVVATIYAGDGEQGRLEDEELELQGVAEVKWLEVAFG